MMPGSRHGKGYSRNKKKVKSIVKYSVYEGMSEPIHFSMYFRASSEG